MGPPSWRGRDPATIRVKDVTSTGFKFQLDEWDYLDGIHPKEYVCYIVMEKGKYSSADGVIWEAGSIPEVDTIWKTAYLKSDFKSIPIILTQTVTVNEPSAVVTRVRNYDPTELTFDIKLQEEEGNDGIHTGETVHYIAMNPASGVFNNRKFLVSKTGTNVTDEWYDIDWSDMGDVSSPTFIAGMQTCNENDPCALRYANLLDKHVEIKCEEEKSGDSEIIHAAEDVGYLVMWAAAGGAPSTFTTAEVEEVFENYIKLPSSLISGNLILNVSSNYDRKASFELIDIAGRIVERRTLNLKRGRENINLGEFISGD
jgi:hypothetical protein